jgi:hypothetical protein
VSAGSLLDQALTAEADAYRALLAGGLATAPLAEARDAYLASHAETGPGSWGRLLGALKMAILLGDAAPVAVRARDEANQAETPAAAYVAALAAVVLGERPDVAAMLAAGEAFERTGRALAALGDGDQVAYRSALTDILADFEGRDQHLSGVAFADTAAVLERLAEPLGMAVRPRSALLPGGSAAGRPPVYFPPSGL